MKKTVTGNGLGFAALVLTFCILADASVAQCPEVSFTLPTTACYNQPILPQNTSDLPDNPFFWDYCPGDLSGNPSGVVVRRVPDANLPSGVTVVQEDGEYFMFITGRNSHSLIRLDLGTDLHNPSPDVVNMGNLDNALKGPVGIRLLKEDQHWYGLVYNSGTDSLVRIEFGTAITNLHPAAVNVARAQLAGNVHSGLDVGVSSEGVVAIVSNQAGVALINFGNTITNTPDPSADVRKVAGMTGRGVNLLHHCGQWYGFVVTGSNVSGNVFRLDFGASLFSDPTVTDITGTYEGSGSFQDVRVLYDAGEYVGFVLTNQGGVLRMAFGADITATPGVVSLERLGETSGFVRMEFMRLESRWSVFTFNTGTRDVIRGDFPDACSARIPVEKGYTPSENVFDEAGVYKVVLERYDSQTGWSFATREITIEDKRAPGIDFAFNGVCAMGETEFSLQSDQSVTGAYWDFGNGDSSTGETVAYSFQQAGTFPVRVQIVAENGCESMRTRAVKVYGKPALDFTVPSGPLCTNTDITLSNLTEDVYDGNLSYVWLVDGAPAGTARDLEYKLASTDVHDVTLETSLPGCSDKITKTISGILPGPVVDFVYQGKCEGASFSFETILSEPVDHYHWDFGNGLNASDANPGVVFGEAGEYAVSLRVRSPNGCENEMEKPVRVYALPVVDFSVGSPPNACSSQPVKFRNDTHHPDGGEIDAWLWQFDSGETSDAFEPVHMFADAGDHPVSLTAVTAEGCTATKEKGVGIYASPPVDLRSTVACLNVPAAFAVAESTDITDWYWETGTSYYVTPSPTHVFRSAGNHALVLRVTAANGCVSTATHTITVPEPLTPAFTLQRACADQETVLTDITGGTDSVVARRWTFHDGQAFTDSIVTYRFDEPGLTTVSLTVTGASGCAYERTVPIEILPGPMAEFSLTPSSGAYPLEVTFENTSARSSDWRWTIHDGTGFTTTVFSPVYLFTTPGTFDVELVASDEQGCYDTFVSSVNIVHPVPGVALEQMMVFSNTDGSARIIVTIHNKGSTVLKELPVDVDLGGEVQLQQVLSGPVLPQSKANFVFNAGIVDLQKYSYLCVSLDLPGDPDTADNTICRPTGNALITLPAYPNPNRGLLTLEWVAPSAGTVGITLTDHQGRRSFFREAAGKAGLNSLLVDVSGLDDGLYYLIVEYGNARDVQKILLINRP